MDGFGVNAAIIGFVERTQKWLLDWLLQEHNCS
jgi:hypothetical protein